MESRRSSSIWSCAPACLGLGLLCLWSSAAAAADARSIGWRNDLAQARAEAQKRNAPLWLQFTAPWCHFCHLMERESFTHPRIIGQSRDAFIPVKLQSEQHEDLIARYGVQGLPASVIISPSGFVLAKHEGFTDAMTFHAFLASALGRHRPRRPVAPLVERPRERIELAGYCPVTLVQEHRLALGQEGVSQRYDGRTYRFASIQAQKQFQDEPERYIPVIGGRCPVAQIDRGGTAGGDPHFGILFQGHLYLCADEASRQQFLKSPERYARVDVAEREFCPHCWGRDRFVNQGTEPLPRSTASSHLLLPVLGQIPAFRLGSDTLRR